MLFEVGTQYYVSTSGSDSNNGLSRATAFATVGKAYSAGVMSAGDGVLILPGEYDQGTGTLVAPPYTLTQGCGIDVTVIKGAVASSRPVLRLSSGCRFVDLTVSHTQTSSSFAFGTSPDLIDTGRTSQQALRLISTFSAGTLSGVGNGMEIYRNAVDDTTDRMVVAVDPQSSRTLIDYDLT